MAGVCKGCKFNFSGMCADMYYEESVVDTENEEKDCYTEGYEDFMKRIRKIHPLPWQTKLSDVVDANSADNIRLKDFHQRNYYCTLPAKTVYYQYGDLSVTGYKEDVYGRTMYIVKGLMERSESL